MATQAIDLRNNRVVVLVSEGEKRRIAANASAADMSVSDFMRTAAERYSEPTEAERLLMADLLAGLEQANERTRRSFEGVEAALERSRAYDEAAHKAKVRAELEARTDIDWNKVADFLGLARDTEH